MSINKVLVVDDSSADLMHLTSIIEQAGYSTVTARSGREAVELARQQMPDVIFLDVIMQEMDGFEACRRLAKDGDTKGIPVVLVTSKNQKADRVWAEMQGARGFISKPYTQDAIIRQLQSMQ